MNYIKLEIGGKERGAKFGLGFLERVQNEEKVTFNEVLTKSTEVTWIPKLLFHSLAFNCERANESIDFDKFTVYDWIEEIGFHSKAYVEFQVAYLKSLKTFLPEDMHKQLDDLIQAEEGKIKPVKKLAKKQTSTGIEM